MEKVSEEMKRKKNLMQDSRDPFHHLMQNASEAIIGAIGDGMSVQDTDFRILFMNQTAKGMFGDRVGEYCYRVYEQRDHVCEQCPLARSFADGGIHREERSNPTRTLHVEITASPVRDVNGRVIAGIETVRDITGRRRMEERLREGEERFRRIFEDGPLGMIINDPGGKVLKVNRAFCGMLGYTEEELVGRSSEEFTFPEDIERSARLSGQFLKGGIPFSQMEKRYVKKNRKILWINLTATAIRDQEGKVLYIIGMVEDISERKWAEREREKLICELQAAIANIKTLRGLIPMCAWCKKIREDSGYWKKVETYIQEHSDALFTHGICPECLKKQDPTTYEKMFENENECGGLKREKRRFERTHLAKPAECVLRVNAGKSRKAILSAAIENISDAGMCVRTGRPLEQGCVVTLSDGNGVKRTGIVRWQDKAHDDPNTYRTGIQFVPNRIRRGRISQGGRNGAQK